jgi:hypothetical protein
MKLAATIARSLQADMQTELRDIERAVAAGTRAAGRGLRTELRRQIASARLGQRLANIWRDKHYPNQQLDAASLVYTRAPQITRAFDEGAVIRSRRGRFLAIPTENAPRKRTDGRRISPSTFPEHRFGPLRFVPLHEVLAANAKRRGNEARARTPAPLRGLMRCTHCSSAMTPTHTRRRGRLYRYYICLGASRRGHDTCPVRSIAASEVEGLVLGQVRRLLASPELVARTITAVRRENGSAEAAVLEEGDVIEALGALEPVWDELYPAEKARILRLLIERIDVAPDGISITLHAAGIRSLVAELASEDAAESAMLEAAE